MRELDRSNVSRAFGAALRSARLERGWSQESLAERASLDRTYVSGVERGTRNPTVHTLWRIAEGLGLRPSELVAAAECLLANDKGSDGGQV